MTEGRSLKGEIVVVNGDEWVVVDEAPAALLAEMVAALLEDEGYVVMVRGLDLQSDTFSHLGGTSITATHVLVPRDQAEAAFELIAATVTDYEGEELDDLMARLERGEKVEGFEPGEVEDPDSPEDEDEDIP